MHFTIRLRLDLGHRLLVFASTTTIGFLTNYDVTRVERKAAELLGINSFVQKRAQNREKTTSGNYSDA